MAYIFLSSTLYPDFLLKTRRNIKHLQRFANFFDVVNDPNLLSENKKNKKKAPEKAFLNLNLDQ